MAVIQLKQCDTCKGQTLHEFVPKVREHLCYWLCRTCGAKQRKPHLLVHLSFHHRCSYRCPDGVLRRARLMDISPIGARIRLAADEPADHIGLTSPVAFRADLCHEGPLAGFIPGTVRWNKATDYGIQFLKRLPLHVQDLEALAG